MKTSKPSYHNLSEKEFKNRIEKGYEILESCKLCSNLCKVNRLKGDRGKCDIGGDLTISSFSMHFGEEPPISGKKGSGTVFLTGCCMFCRFCQNYPISQFNNGVEYSLEAFTEEVLRLQGRGVQNINFVSPTHQVPQILEGIFHARERGLNLPLVYNTGGYDSYECLKLLDGIVDIYLPDFKYADNETAKKYSGIDNYVETAKTAIAEMYRQVGKLKIDENGIAQKGMIIRHLVLPENIAQTEKVFGILKEIIPVEINVSIMGQYFPAHKAPGEGPNRKITEDEYLKAIDAAINCGFKNVFTQILDFEPCDITVPPSL